MKKICVITTCRSDFGYLYWIMKDIEASDKLELQVMYPYTHQCHDEIWNTFTDHNNHAVLGDMNSIYDIGQFFDRCLEAYNILKPDFVLVLGDRFEIHAAATAALLLNMPIAHIHGGEVTTGAFDNELRNAITMMADIHFTSNYDYSMNLCKMGINGLKVFTVGSPGLDYIHRAKLLSKQELQQRVTIDLNQPFIVACLQPTTKEPDRETTHAFNFMAALTSIDEQILMISPNCDPKNNVIRQVAQATAKNYPSKIHIVENLDHLTYLSLLQYAEMMVGNSSSGIIESASFNIPSVTVGSRQDGRIKASNTFSCPCETDAILTAIDRAREWNALMGKCENPYGDGKSSQRIVKILEEIP